VKRKVFIVCTLLSLAFFNAWGAIITTNNCVAVVNLIAFICCLGTAALWTGTLLPFSSTSTPAVASPPLSSTSQAVPPKPKMFCSIFSCVYKSVDGSCLYHLSSLCPHAANHLVTPECKDVQVTGMTEVKEVIYDDNDRSKGRIVKDGETLCLTENDYGIVMRRGKFRKDVSWPSSGFLGWFKASGDQIAKAVLAIFGIGFLASIVIKPESLAIAIIILAAVPMAIAVILNLWIESKRDKMGA
jgi:hypothetical protein